MIMPVKEVSYQRLFTLGNYNNEKIGIIATIGEGENPDKVIGQLCLKVFSIEEVLETYRDMVAEVFHCEEQVVRHQSLVETTENKIVKMKVDLAELGKALKEKREIDERLRHACSTQSYKSLKTTLETYKKDVEAWKKRLTKAKENQKILQQRIDEGNFTVEGMELGRKPKEFF